MMGRICLKIWCSLYEYRANIINLSDGICVSQLLLGKSHHLFAVRTPSAKNKFKARQGAKAVKKLERLESSSQILTREEATTYRALSAWANYLAQDQAVVAFSTKELCREFAVPTRDSYIATPCRWTQRIPRHVTGMTFHRCACTMGLAQPILFLPGASSDFACW